MISIQNLYIFIKFIYYLYSIFV